MDLDVALDPLRAHDELRTPLTRGAQVIPRVHTGALRGGVDGDDRLFPMRWRGQRSMLIEVAAINRGHRKVCS